MEIFILTLNAIVHRRDTEGAKDYKFLFFAERAKNKKMHLT